MLPDDHVISFGPFAGMTCAAAEKASHDYKSGHRTTGRDWMGWALSHYMRAVDPAKHPNSATKRLLADRVHIGNYMAALSPAYAEYALDPGALELSWVEYCPVCGLLAPCADDIVVEAQDSGRDTLRWRRHDVACPRGHYERHYEDGVTTAVIAGVVLGPLKSGVVEFRPYIDAVAAARAAWRADHPPREPT